HMDGIGWGEAANDDGSGAALVMQLARIFSGPDVRTDRSIRFILWNNEETGLNGSRAYVEQRQVLQGKEDPPGSGRYPEPTRLGAVPGPGGGDQSARERARGAHRGGMGPELAPADRPVRHLRRQGLPARAECGANHPGGARRPRGDDGQVAVRRPCFPWPFKIRTIATIVFQLRVVAGMPTSLSIWPR